MVQTIFAKDISLYELEEQFGLKATDDSCFTEWLSNSPLISESDKQALNRVRSNYLNLIKRRFMSEEAVKMVVLSPLLDLAGFYQPPYIGLGKPYIQGHRIWVSLILDLLASGKTMEEILEQYPSIERDDILACIAYGAEMVEKSVELQQLEVTKQNGVVYADFSEMANDQEYQEEALAICKEFERADWEALQLGESE